MEGRRSGVNGLPIACAIAFSLVSSSTVSSVILKPQTPSEGDDEFRSLIPQWPWSRQNSSSQAAAVDQPVSPAPLFSTAVTEVAAEPPPALGTSTNRATATAPANNRPVQAETGIRFLTPGGSSPESKHQQGESQNEQQAPTPVAEATITTVARESHSHRAKAAIITAALESSQAVPTETVSAETASAETVSLAPTTAPENTAPDALVVAASTTAPPPVTDFAASSATRPKSDIPAGAESKSAPQNEPGSKPAAMQATNPAEVALQYSMLRPMPAPSPDSEPSQEAKHASQRLRSASLRRSAQPKHAIVPGFDDTSAAKPPAQRSTKVQPPQPEVVATATSRGWNTWIGFSLVTVVTVVFGVAEIHYTGAIGWITGVAFTLASFVSALAVRRRDLITAVITPPIAFLIGVALAIQPTTLQTQGNLKLQEVSAMFTAVALNAGWAFAATGLALTTVLVRYAIGMRKK